MDTKITKANLKKVFCIIEYAQFFCEFNVVLKDYLQKMMYFRDCKYVA